VKKKEEKLLFLGQIHINLSLNSKPNTRIIKPKPNSRPAWRSKQKVRPAPRPGLRDTRLACLGPGNPSVRPACPGRPDPWSVRPTCSSSPAPHPWINPWSSRSDLPIFFNWVWTRNPNLGFSRPFKTRFRPFKRCYDQDSEENYFGGYPNP
jgi:hypothetical protein